MPPNAFTRVDLPSHEVLACAQTDAHAVADVSARDSLEIC